MQIAMKPESAISVASDFCVANWVGRERARKDHCLEGTTKRIFSAHNIPGPSYRRREVNTARVRQGWSMAAFHTS